MATLVSFFLGPIGRWVGIALLVGGVAGGLYLKGDLHGRQVEIQKVQTQNARDIQKGTAARNSAIKRFNSNGVRDDGFCRDC